MSYLSEQDTDSPLSRWRFEETTGTTVDDDLTTTRDGAINGAVTLNQPARFVDGGLGADFAGGHVSMGDMSGLLGLGAVEAVVEFDTIPTGTNAPAIFSHAYNSSILPLVVGVNVGGTSSYSGLIGVGYFTGSTWQSVHWTTPPSTGVAYHIVGTYDGTTLRLYVNGTEVASGTPSAARPASGAVLSTGYIGKRWDFAQYHDGRIWDVALYSTALSSTRVSAHYMALANAFTDDFASAKAISDKYQISGVDTTTWGTEASEPGGIFNTGWVKFTPTVTDLYRFSTAGSNYDTVLNVYTGTTLTDLVLVASDDDSGGSGASQLSATLTSGTTYYVQVGSKAAGGGILAFSLNSLADARLGAVSSEALYSVTSAGRRLAGVSAEVVTNSAGPTYRRLGSVTVEVLVPARLAFIGWGVPVKSRTWS